MPNKENTHTAEGFTSRSAKTHPIKRRQAVKGRAGEALPTVDSPCLWFWLAAESGQLRRRLSIEALSQRAGRRYDIGAGEREEAGEGDDS